MKVDLQTLRALPKQALNAVNTVGSTTIGLAKGGKALAAQHMPKIIKDNKNTIAGSAVILAAALIAIKAIKGIAHKIHDAKVSKK
ncbi:hypothetical protein IJ531_04725 [bacterium]|nr:hypothetical protein [bacterium]